MSLDRTEELLAANRVLRESEERFRSLTEISADFFWETDAQHRCTAIEFGSAYRGSRALGAKLGKTRWEIPPASPGEAEWNAHRAEIAAHRRFVNFGFSRIEGGEERFYEESGAPRFGPQGEFLGYRGIGRDITERTRAEADLRASEARFRSLTELSSDFYWETDTEHRYTAIELGWAYTGVRNNKSKLGLARWEIPHASPDPAAWEAHRAAIASRERFVGFRFSRLEEGEERFYEHSGEPRYDAQGNFLGYRGVGRDVTERKRAEEALRRSEERYSQAMDASEEGHFDVNLDTDEHFTSERLNEIHGFPPSTRTAKRSEYMKHVRFYGDDAEKYYAAIAAADVKDGPERYEFEFRIVRPSGDVRWLRTRGKVTRDAEGRACRRTGMVADVTEAKLADQALRESEQRYELAMAASESGYWDWHIPTGRYFVSARANELAGLETENTFADRADFRARIPMHPEDSARWEAAREDLFAGTGERLAMECRYIVRGETRWHSLQAICRRDDTGKVVRWTGSATDITQRKLAEEALRRSEERYGLAMEASEEGHFDLNIETGEIFISERLNEIYGFAPGTRFANRDEYLAQVRLHGEDVEKYHAALDAAVARQGPERYEFEFRIVRPSGEVRWLSTRGKVTRDADARALRRTGVVTDITDRKRAEEELRESEARFRGLTELLSDWYWEQDENLRFTYLSNQAAQLTGYSGESSLGKTRWEIENMTSLSCSWAEHQAVLAARHPFRDLECRRVGPDGTVRYLSMSGAPIFDAEGRFRGYRGIGRNITARKQAEQALRDSEALKSAMFETALDCIISMGHDGQVIEFNPAAERTFGYRRAEAIGKDLAELIIPPRLREQHRRGLARYLATGEGPVLGTRIEMSALRADGAEFPVELSVTRIPGEGAPLFTAYLRDITERKRAEEKLRESEARFRSLTEISSDWYWRQDENLRFTYLSAGVSERAGWPADDYLGRLRWEVPDIHPISCSWEEHRDVLAMRRPFRDLEYWRPGKDGLIIYSSISGAPIFDEQGRFKGYQGIGRNINERKRIEEELRRMERLAQRLEAMGTLAGGIAHDFNNILGAILGFSEMAWREAPKGSRLQRDLESIATAGERGRALVERILAFSRSGVGERVAVHVERVVREALDLLSAKLPPSVTLRAELRAGRAAMLGDPTQVHQVLMNLGINAVQAMPSGGILRVSLDVLRCEAARAAAIGKVAAGEYVVLRVADSGTGIAPEILERIFEPFFTTKELGTGTGLGLSLVHGIVTELGGAIDLESTSGKGTAFTVHLPRSGDALDSSEKEDSELPRGEGQRVLVVDDEEPLVRLATRTLEDLGYRPVGFTSSAAALAAFCADPGRFDALIADERMPGLSGTALIREVRGVRQAIPILLMSGYVGGALTSLARDAGADDVLKKPVLARDLATSLARVLHS